ncbi:hypothetical protein PS15m_006626 [Mucor circinelloides]
MQFYLNQLKDVEAQDLYEAVISKKFGLESNGKWVQDCFYDCIRLLRSDFFPLTNVSEAGIVKRMWSCLDACFDFSVIKCISGEKCSKSSADAINANRTSILTRQSCGRKMDYLFTASDYVEIGRGECALVGGVNTTKELCDASFKMAKVMKAMAVNLVSKSSDMKDKLAIAGFYIGDDKLTLLVLDCPTKYTVLNDFSLSPINSTRKVHPFFLIPLSIFLSYLSIIFESSLNQALIRALKLACLYNHFL